MTSGIPDYYRTVRQAYGAAKTGLFSDAVAADDDTELISIDGKGVLYGGSLYLAYTSTQRDAIPKLSIDGFEISTLNFFTLNYFNLTGLYSYPVRLVQYDEVNYKYGVALAFGFTFDSSIKLVYEENNSTTPTVVARLIYAEI